jgi:hypothetical protein
MVNKLPVRPTIIIDTREKPGYRLFASSPDGDKDVAAYIEEKVDAGDYTIKEIPNLVVIEKKADGKELYGNLVTNKDTFMRCIDRMRAFKHKYIVIQQTYAEFLDPKNWTFINPYPRRFSVMAMVESWLISLSQTEGIHFIFAGKANAPRLARRILVKSYEYERKRIKNGQKDLDDETANISTEDVANPRPGNNVKGGSETSV